MTKQIKNTDYFTNFTPTLLAIYVNAERHLIGDPEISGANLKVLEAIAIDLSGDTSLSVVWENDTHFATHGIDSGIEVFLVISKSLQEVVSSAEVC